MIAQFTVLFEINYTSNVQNSIWLRLMLFWTLLVLVNCAITYANRCNRYRQFILGVYYYNISCAARTSDSPVVLPLGSETIATFARGKGLIFLDDVDCIGTELFFSLFFPQVLMPGKEQHLAKEGVLSFWIMLAAMEQSSGLLTAQTLELVSITVDTLKMLE